MKHAIIALIMTIVLVVIPVAAISATTNNHPHPAAAAAEADQTITLPGHTITVSAPPVTVPGPKITVTLPGHNVTIPGPTITVPGNITTRTATVTRTVKVEGPRSTTTITRPAQTRTVSVPGPTHTVSEHDTLTVSPSEIGGRQDGDGSGTLDPGNRGPTITIPYIDLSFPQVIGYGTLTVLLAAALIVLGMWGGYYMGYKDSQKNEASFLRSLLRRDKG